MSNPLVLFGCGGHAKVLLEAIRARTPDRTIFVVDDRAEGQLMDLPVSGPSDWLRNNVPRAPVALGIGGNAARFEVMKRLAEQGREFETVIHPSSIVGSTVTIGEGAFIAAGAVLIADARIGRGAIVNTAASVDHDCIVGEAAHIAPGTRLCGNVQVGARTLVGVGSSVAPGVVIGPDAVIGAGSVVVQSLAGNATYVGCPAKALRAS